MKNVYSFRKAVVIITTLILAQITSGQGVAINNSGTPPDNSAMLDVSSTAKGFLLPRMTTAERDSIHSPAPALMIYNTTTNCLEAYALGAWRAASCFCSAPPSTPGPITGDTISCSGSALTYSISGVGGAIFYTWSVPTGSNITSGQGTTSISLSPGSNSGSVSVVANNNCGSSNPSSLSLTISSTPTTPGNISGSPTPCSNSTVTYSISAVTGASSYTWTVPSDATISGSQTSTSAIVNFGTGSGTVCVTANNSCGSSAASCLGITVQGGGSSGSQTFNFTGNQQTFLVPTCATSINVDAYGAAGGTSAGLTCIGGGGGEVQATLATTPGQTLYIYVGGKGGDAAGAAGYNGGGTGLANGQYKGGSGGGATDIRAVGTDLGSRILVAGGGGGGGTNSPPYDDGGLGGGLTGGTSNPSAGWGGQGGSQLIGGAGGVFSGWTTGVQGSSGNGGSAGSGTGGGGGGGGYFGGGGGSWGGGGGGSSYTIIGSTNVVHNQGVETGNGTITITW